MVAQEDRPLAVRRNVGRLAQDVGDGEAVLAGDRHVHARHQREVECHVALVVVAEIVLGVFRPLVCFGQQHTVRIVRIHLGPDLLQHRVGFRQVLVVGTLALDQIWDGVQAQPVHAEIQPVAQDCQHLLQHALIVEVQIRLVRIEPMPIIRPGLLVPRPVGALRINENDARSGVFSVIIRPYIEVPIDRADLRLACALEPRMLVRGVVHHQLGDNPHPALVRRGDEAADVGQRAVIGMHAAIVADVVAIIAPRRGIERQ